MMEEILLISEDRLFARMLVLELAALHKTTTVRPSLKTEDFAAYLQTGQYRLLILDLDVSYTELDNILHLTVEHKLPVILFGHPDSDAMTPQKLRFYDSAISRYVFQRPFLMNQFLYCAKELLQYKEDADPELPEAPVMKMKQHCPADDIRINEIAHTVFYKNDPISLTATEYALLLLFMRQRGAVLSRDEIYRTVWNRAPRTDKESNIVDVYVRYLRAKLDEPYRIKLIETVRGVGYTIQKQ